MTELADVTIRRPAAAGGAAEEKVTILSGPYQRLLDGDTHDVPAVLRLRHNACLGTEDIPVERYTSRAYHELEKQRLWSRVWQFACREEHLPEPGDTVVYDIAGRSYILVRQEDGTIRGYVNACLHRGRRLRDYDGHCDSSSPLPLPRLRLAARRATGQRPGRLGLPAAA